MVKLNFCFGLRSFRFTRQINATPSLPFAKIYKCNLFKVWHTRCEEYPAGDSLPSHPTSDVKITPLVGNCWSIERVYQVHGWLLQWGCWSYLSCLSPSQLFKSMRHFLRLSQNLYGWWNILFFGKNSYTSLLDCGSHYHTKIIIFILEIVWPWMSLQIFPMKIILVLLPCAAF